MSKNNFAMGQEPVAAADWPNLTELNLSRIEPLQLYLWSDFSEILDLDSTIN